MKHERDDVVEIDVEVRRQGERAVLVFNGENEAWIPHSLIDDDSEIHERTSEGGSGTLVIPLWKAEELKWV